MNQITTLTSSPNQFHRLVLDNNETADFTLRFCARVESWFFDIQYNDIEARGLKIVLSPNSLRHLKNIIPFGIAFSTESFVQPFKIDDFSSGRIKMYVLNSDEVNQVEREIFNIQ